MTDDEKDLRSRFEALRRDEARFTPAFRVRSQAAREGGYGWAWVKLPAAACLAVLIAAMLWWREPVIERPRVDTSQPVGSIAEWKAPTDFLLETPGGELLRGVPAFGAEAGYGNAPKSGQKRTNHTKKTLP